MPAARRPRGTSVTMLGSGKAQKPDFQPLEAPQSDGTAKQVSVGLLALTERQFQRLLVEALRERGWTVWTVPNMKLTTAGLPDVLAWHARLPGLLLALELKRERDSRVSPAQTAALAHLQTVPGIDARILRPSGWERLRDTLDLMLTLSPAARAAGEETR